MAKNNLNSVSLSGNLTAEAELRYTSGNVAIVTFTIAVNYTYGERENVSFIDVKVFGKLGEVLHQYLGKGKPVIVSGRLEQERWQAQDGGNRSKVVVIADFIELLRDGQPSAQRPAQSTGRSEYYKPPEPQRGPELFVGDPIDDSTIPF